MCFVSLKYFRPANLRRSVDLINEKLRGTKKLDLYESARVDPSVPIEEAIQTLIVLKNEGKFDHIGMSECKAETLRRANAVCLLEYGVAFARLTFCRRFTR
jgi:pyridoxine 4-dehydrogenase